MIYMDNKGYSSVKMKVCLRLQIFEISDCTLRLFRGYDFSIFLILLFLDRYFGGFDSYLRASPRMFSYGVPPLLVIMATPITGRGMITLEID